MTGELEAAEYLENPIQCRDGRQRLIAWHNANLTDNNGLIIGTLSSGEDITERKQVEEALRASEARFRQLADAMPQLVWTANPDGGVNFRNNIHFAAYAATNQTTEGLVDWLPLLHAEDIQRTLEAWQGAIASGNSYACEHRVRMADGTMRWHLSRAEPVRDVAGSIVKWIGTTTDIQDVKQAQERLRESDQRKSEFLATLAHELRNPLAPIRHAAEILLAAGPVRSGPGRRLTTSLTARSGTWCGSSMTSWRRTASRGTASVATRTGGTGGAPGAGVGHLPPPGRAGGPHPPGNHAPGSHRARCGSGASGPDISESPQQCRQVHRAGMIYLDARCDETAVVVTVADTGIGIAAEHLPRVFEMFFSDAGAGQSPGGLGIGLALRGGRAPWRTYRGQEPGPGPGHRVYRASAHPGRTPGRAGTGRRRARRLATLGGGPHPGGG